MARFNFRLKGFLHIKTKLEDQRKLEYGKALQQLEKEKKKKLQLIEQLGIQIKLFRNSLHTLIQPADISRYNNTIESIKHRIIEQDKHIAAAEVHTEEKRVALVEAVKERKMLESIKDKQFEEYMREERHAEQKVFDEVTSYQYKLSIHQACS